MAIQSFRDLEVWRLSIDLAAHVYELTLAFPRDERFGLSAQIQRAGVSIPSNIAEGSQQGTTLSLIRYLRMALGSLAEVETHLELARRLHYAKDDQIRVLEKQAVTTGRKMNALIASLKSRTTPP